MQKNQSPIQFVRDHFLVKIKYDSLDQIIDIEAISQTKRKKYTLTVVNDTLPPIAKVLFQDAQGTFSYIEANADHPNVVYMNDKGHLQVLFHTMIGKVEKKRVVLFQLEQSELIGDIMEQKKSAVASNDDVKQLRNRIAELEKRVHGQQNQSALQNKIIILQKQMASFARYNQALTMKFQQLQKQNERNQVIIKQLRNKEKSEAQFKQTTNSHLNNHKDVLESLIEKTGKIQNAVVKLIEKQSNKLNSSSSFKTIPTIRPNPFYPKQQEKVECQNQ